MSLHLLNNKIFIICKTIILPYENKRKKKSPTQTVATMIQTTKYRERRVKEIIKKIYKRKNNGNQDGPIIKIAQVPQSTATSESDEI